MTATDTIIQVQLDLIHPNPDNRRVGGFDPVKLQELADSIRDVGVVQPITVRAKLKGDGYELVAGERRWRAAKLAGLSEIPALVRELDDLQVLKIATIENLQREDVHPLDEADGYARLIDLAGYDVDKIAAELGKSASYVYQRLKLRELIDPLRDLLTDGTIDAGHAILAARLPEGQQQEVLEYLVRRREDVSVDELDQWIHERVLMDLSRANWKRDDAGLLPEAGACSACPKRTGYQPVLFADVSNGSKKDYCLDRACFNAKCLAVVARRRQELKDEPHLEVIKSHGVRYEEEQRLEKQGVIGPYSWQECKKDDKDAQKALIVAGDGQGRITYGKLNRDRTETRRQVAKTNPKEAERLRRERAKTILENKVARRLHRLIWERVTAAAAENIKKRQELPLEALRAVVATIEGKEWQNRDLISEAGKLSAKATAEELLLRLIQILVAPALNQDNTSDYGLEDAKKLAAVYDVDLKALEREAREECAKPKEKPAKNKPPVRKKGPRREDVVTEIPAEEDEEA